MTALRAVRLEHSTGSCLIVFGSDLMLEMFNLSNDIHSSDFIDSMIWS